MRPFSTMIAVTMLTALSFSARPTLAGETEISKTAEAHFVDLKDDDTVQSPFVVRFASSGLTIEPTGAAKPNAGHFHLLIDKTLSAQEMLFAIPTDDQALHFGKAQTETTLSLPPGRHTLQIVMGDGAHELHKMPVMSKVITVNVGCSR